MILSPMEKTEIVAQKSAHELLLAVLSELRSPDAKDLENRFLASVFGSLETFDRYRLYLEPRRKLQARRALLARFGRLEDALKRLRSPSGGHFEQFFADLETRNIKSVWEKERMARLRAGESYEFEALLHWIVEQATPDNSDIPKLEGELDRLLGERVQAALDKFAAIDSNDPHYQKVSDAISRVRGMLSEVKVA